MLEEPRRQLRRPRPRRLRRVHAVARGHRRRPQLHQMRCLRLPPQLPPPRARGAANFSGDASCSGVPAPPPSPPSPATAAPESELLLSAADLLLPLRTAHAPRPLQRRRPLRGPREHRRARSAAPLPETLPHEIHPGAEGEDARVRRQSGLEDAEARRKHGYGVLQRGWRRQRSPQSVDAQQQEHLGQKGQPQCYLCQRD